MKNFKKKQFKEILDALIDNQNSAQLTAEEQETLEEVMRLLDDLDKNLKDLDEAKKEGMSRTSWINYRLRKSVRRLNVTEEEEERFIADIDQVIGEELINQLSEEKKEQTPTNQATEEAKQ